MDPNIDVRAHNILCFGLADHRLLASCRLWQTHNTMCGVGLKPEHVASIDVLKEGREQQGSHGKPTGHMRPGLQSMRSRSSSRARNRQGNERGQGAPVESGQPRRDTYALGKHWRRGERAQETPRPRAVAGAFVRTGRAILNNSRLIRERLVFQNCC